MGVSSFSSSRPISTTGSVLEGVTASGMALGRNVFSRFALATTDSDDMAIAAAAIIGLRVRPKAGYSAPAAIGIPIPL